mgnify:FL=1
MSSRSANSVPLDYSKSCGGAALGARLRRASEVIDRQATLIYQMFGTEFEQRWYGILNLLHRFGGLTVGEIAASLCISHVAVVQARASLESRQFIKSKTDINDSRRRILSLTSQGRALVEHLMPIWQHMDDAARALNAESGDLVATLDALEKMQARVNQRGG